MEDADEKRNRLAIASFLAAAGLFFAAQLLSGPLSLTIALLGGIGLSVGLAAIFDTGPVDDRPWHTPRQCGSAPSPQAELEQDINVNNDAPPSTRRWRKRVQHEAEDRAWLELRRVGRDCTVSEATSTSSLDCVSGMGAGGPARRSS